MAGKTKADLEKELEEVTSERNKLRGMLLSLSEYILHHSPAGLVNDGDSLTITSPSEEVHKLVTFYTGRMVGRIRNLEHYLEEAERKVEQYEQDYRAAYDIMQSDAPYITAEKRRFPGSAADMASLFCQAFQDLKSKHKEETEELSAARKVVSACPHLKGALVASSLATVIHEMWRKLDDLKDGHEEEVEDLKNTIGDLSDEVDRLVQRARRLKKERNAAKAQRNELRRLIKELVRKNSEA